MPNRAWRDPFYKRKVAHSRILNDKEDGALCDKVERRSTAAAGGTFKERKETLVIRKVWDANCRILKEHLDTVEQLLVSSTGYTLDELYEIMNAIYEGTPAQVEAEFVLRIEDLFQNILRDGDIELSELALPTALPHYFVLLPGHRQWHIIFKIHTGTDSSATHHEILELQGVSNLVPEGTYPGTRYFMLFAPVFNTVAISIAVAVNVRVYLFDVLSVLLLEKWLKDNIEEEQDAEAIAGNFDNFFGTAPGLANIEQGGKLILRAQ